jgi:hypothetical protein
MRDDFEDEAATTEIGVAETGGVSDDDVTMELPPVSRKVITHRRVLGRVARRSRSPK